MGVELRKLHISTPSRACVVGVLAPYNHGLPLAGATLSRPAFEGANESLRELFVPATVLRENLVKLTDIPLIGRIPALPETLPNTRVMLEIGAIDLLDLNFEARPVSGATAAA